MKYSTIIALLMGVAMVQGAKLEQANVEPCEPALDVSLEELNI